MELSEKAITAINARSGLNCRNRLAYEMKASQQTIMRWISINDTMLTTATALQIIREETGLTDDEILVKEEAHK
jgi:hypothetical protein